MNYIPTWWSSVYVMKGYRDNKVIFGWFILCSKHTCYFVYPDKCPLCMRDRKSQHKKEE